tara:strand:+ start:238 stop:453 length:216 start_codon:yes stop_codon:yes gene_type:complete
MEKNKLTPWEAKRNLKEMVEKIGHEHAREVEDKISEAIYDELYLEFGETMYQTCDEDGTIDQKLDYYDWGE